jgi:hypothetical protein
MVLSIGEEILSEENNILSGEREDLSKEADAWVFKIVSFVSIL